MKSTKVSQLLGICCYFIAIKQAPWCEWVEGQISLLLSVFWFLVTYVKHFLCLSADIMHFFVHHNNHLTCIWQDHTSQSDLFYIRDRPLLHSVNPNYFKRYRVLLSFFFFKRSCIRLQISLRFGAVLAKFQCVFDWIQSIYSETRV